MTLVPQTNDKPGAQAQPPHKFWRGMWEFSGSAQELAAVHLYWDLYDNSLPKVYPLNPERTRILDGPIYPTAELCEQEQLLLQQSNHSRRRSIIWFFIKPVKTDEFGAPL